MPCSLFRRLTSNRSQDQWHFVNVKYDKDDRARRLYRRITISRFERLRTAIDRLTELSVAGMQRDLFGLSAFQVQQAHDRAFDVEKVTKDFFEAYQREFKELQKDLQQQTKDLRWAHDYALQFLNRVMFLYFVQRKLWLRSEQAPKGDPDFLNTFWILYQKHGKAADTFYSKWLSVLFFNAFNQGEKDIDDAAWAHLPESLQRSMADAPYLNGGLFRQNDLDKRGGYVITDTRFRRIFDFLERYNFTISEDTPLDQEVAVDPEMIGKVYESLVNVSEDGNVDERSEAGIFYTPRTEIDLMCRLSLVDWLSNHLGKQHISLLYDAVFAFTEDEKRAADDQLRQENMWPEIDRLTKTLQVLDPACGSGSFLVGMLIVLDDLLERVDHELGIIRRPYDRRRDIIGRNLYGVDVKDWAVHVAELRLWLQLVIETEITPTEAKVRPLLPNLSFKVRCGDSLVQEIGGINLAIRHSGQLPDRDIAGRINQLRGEKLNYYTNSTGTLSLKQLQEKEFQVFADLLKARRTKIEARLQNIATGLSTTTDLFGEEVSVTQSASERAKRERERDQLTSELEQVKRAQDALKTAHDVPFVWDIAFVEVFESERRGFDIVIGNPPYVRQEEIRDPRNGLTNAEYKELLARAVYSAWPHTFGYYQSGKKKWTVDAKSDLYVYFYFHALSLLNERGTFCFVTSNTWLDVGYGTELQKFLLTRGRIGLIIDNQVRRSFSDAGVNTAICIFGAAQDTASFQLTAQTNIARFVMFTVPFEVVLNSKTWKNITQAVERATTDEYRIVALTQSELLNRGAARDADSDYTGDKWGGKYLRAPDIYELILQKGQHKFARLRDVAEVRFGIKSGVNEFFYISEDDVATHELPEKFLLPVIKSPRECRGLVINPNSLRFRLFVCNVPRAKLKGTPTLRYIEWGESQGFHLRPSTQGRNPWYDLGERRIPPFTSPSSFSDFCRIFENGRVLVDKRLYEIYPRFSNDWAFISLNTTLNTLFLEIGSRTGLGEGLLDLTVYELADCPIIRPEYAGMLDSRHLNSLRTRNVLPIDKELSQPDRQALDGLLFDTLELTTGEREAVYEAVLNLVTMRLSKAESV